MLCWIVPSALVLINIWRFLDSPLKLPYKVNLYQIYRAAHVEQGSLNCENHDHLPQRPHILDNNVEVDAIFKI